MKNKDAVYSLIRKMKVGDIIYVPYEKWVAARSAASQLGRLFNCYYQVVKDAPKGKIGQIKITKFD